MWILGLGPVNYLKEGQKRAALRGFIICRLASQVEKFDLQEKVSFGHKIYPFSSGHACLVEMTNRLKRFKSHDYGKRQTAD